MMKQHITIDQINELSAKAKEKLQAWWTPQDGDWILHGDIEELNACDQDYGWIVSPGDDLGKEDNLPLLSIGQLIEFLDENSLKIIRQDHEGATCWYVEHKSYINNKNWRFIPELCDTLWEAVKHVLEKE